MVYIPGFPLAVDTRSIRSSIIDGTRSSLSASDLSPCTHSSLFLRNVCGFKARDRKCNRTLQNEKSKCNKELIQRILILTIHTFWLLEK
jgi:hypothetical protein